MRGPILRERIRATCGSIDLMFDGCLGRIRGFGQCDLVIRIRHRVVSRLAALVHQFDCCPIADPDRGGRCIVATDEWTKCWHTANIKRRPP